MFDISPDPVHLGSRFCPLLSQVLAITQNEMKDFCCKVKESIFPMAIQQTVFKAQLSFKILVKIFTH
jgi:hypothetical protein